MNRPSAVLLAILTFVAAAAATPGANAALTTFGDVSSGSSHTCAVTAAGGVLCWGDNTYGQLGDGTRVDRSSPTPVPGLTSGVAAVTAGASHTCALRSSGTVMCWGGNYEGQVGDGTTTMRPAPTAVSGLAGAVAAISAGDDHTCARLTSGALNCWGSNQWGQLGDGTTSRRALAVPVTGLANTTIIASGGRHTCASSGGQVSCWGYNGQGQLGLGDTRNSSTPQPVPGLNGVVSLSAGRLSTCAIDSTGAASCWGANERGQLGTGDTAPQYSPTRVLGLDDAARISVGAYHTCAIGNDGGTRCWGDGHLGQLGDGTWRSTTSPSSTVVLANTKALDLGANHTCAQRADGRLACWGYNAQGQLGDDSVRNRATPVTPWQQPDVPRLAGSDRYATSVQISKQFATPGGVVFVATGLNFPDALAGGAAAAKLGGPLLLVDSNTVPTTVAAELTRLKPSSIVVLGSHPTVSDSVVAALRAYSPDVSRIAGTSRYATAIGVSKFAFPSGADTVMIANGLKFPDALSAGSLFAGSPGPILLSNGADPLEATTLAEVTRLQPRTAYLLGSAASVPESVASQLRQAGVTVVRLAGPNRYETSLAVAREAYPSTTTSVYFTTGTNFPDGLSVGPLAALQPGPVLLVEGGCLPQNTVDYVKSLGASRLVLLGSSSTVPETIGKLTVC